MTCNVDELKTNLIEEKSKFGALFTAGRSELG
jgi:hypothetical protein